MYNYTGMQPSQNLGYGQQAPASYSYGDFNFGSQGPSIPVTPPSAMSFAAPAVPTVAPMGVSAPAVPSVAAATATGAATDPAKRGMFEQIWKTEDGELNFDGLESITKILGTAGSLFGAYQQQKLARDAFDFSKKTFETNLNNSRKTYNTALEDRIGSRHAFEGRSSGETEAYLNRNRL